MYKQAVFSFIALLLVVCGCFKGQAEIVETQSIESILPYIEEDTLVLFNIAEVLTDSTLSLGSSPSRKYIQATAKKMANRPACDVHDIFTWIIFNQIPHKTVEPVTAQLIAGLQEREVVVAALTSRGRTEWYTTEIPGVDDQTDKVLEALGIDLKRTQPPIVSIQMEGAEYLTHYRNGIYYSNHMEKGLFLKKILEDSGYRPKNIVFVDDKLDSLKTVDEAMKELSIPFTGFWYTRTKKDRAGFNPKVAVIQLKSLLEESAVLDEAPAEELAKSTYQNESADELFLEFVEKIDFTQLCEEQHAKPIAL